METAVINDTLAERYELAMQAAGIGIWDNDLLTNTIFFSGTGHQLYGFNEEEVITLEVLISRIHPNDRERTKIKIEESLDPVKQVIYDNEYRVINPQTQGLVRWVRSKGKAYFNEAGRPYRFTGTVQDISQEVKARETHQKLLALVDNSIELMSILESDGKNSYINKAGMQILGFDSMEEVYNTPISDLHLPEDIAFVEANVLPAVMGEGKWSGEMNVRHLKTGEVFPVLNNTVRISDPVTGEPLAIGAVMRDIRPEKAAQRALEESEKNFRTLVMQAPVGICIVTVPDFIIEVANDMFLEVSNKKGESIINRKVVEVYPEATSQGFIDILKQVVETRKPYIGKEVPVLQERSNGSRTVYVDFVFEPLLESDGSIKRVIDLSIDVTDKVLARRRLQENEAELQKRVAERTAELQEKNIELEEFTYVSSHDLQEPIRKIRLFAEMIRENDYEKLSDHSKSRFDKICNSAERMSTSLKELLSFASLNKKEQKEPVDLNVIIKAVETDLELMVEQSAASLKVSGLPKVNAVPSQAHQLFYNLVNNALKFSRKDLNPVIEISHRKLLASELAHPELDSTKNYFEIIVKDNGIGFEQEKADRIFGLFQRLHTRQDYNGSGIGLALCRKIMSKHEGLIFAKSEPNQGAAFHLFFPITED